MNPTQDNKHPWLKIDAAGVGVYLALTLVVYCLGVQPLLARKADSAQRARELSEKRQKASGLVTTLTSLKRELATMEQRLAESPLRLQPMSAVNQRIAMITDLASQSQLTLNEIQPGKASHGTHYATLPIVLTGSGSYPTTAAFLHRLHTTFPDTGVASFTLAAIPTQPDVPATFKLDLAWYAAPIERIEQK
jgi:Tfp pilus assembly protein PilO